MKETYPRQSFVPWRKRVLSGMILLVVLGVLGVGVGFALSPLVVLTSKAF